MDIVATSGCEASEVKLKVLNMEMKEMKEMKVERTCRTGGSEAARELEGSAAEWAVAGGGIGRVMEVDSARGAARSMSDELCAGRGAWTSLRCAEASSSWRRSAVVCERAFWHFELEVGGQEEGRGWRRRSG